MAAHSPISQNLLVLLQPFLQMAVARPNSKKHHFLERVSLKVGARVEFVMLYEVIYQT